MSDPMVDAAGRVMVCDGCKDKVPAPLGNLDWVMQVMKAFEKAHRYCRDGTVGGKTMLAQADGVEVHRANPCGERPDLDDIKARISAGQHATDKDPEMHTDDKGPVWLQAYGDLWPRVHIPQLVAYIEKLEDRVEAAHAILHG